MEIRSIAWTLLAIQTSPRRLLQTTEHWYSRMALEVDSVFGSTTLTHWHSSTTELSLSIGLVLALAGTCPQCSAPTALRFDATHCNTHCNLAVRTAEMLQNFDAAVVCLYAKANSQRPKKQPTFLQIRSTVLQKHVLCIGYCPMSRLLCCVQSSSDRSRCRFFPV